VPAMKQNDLPVFRADLHRSPVSLLFPSMDMLFVVGIVFSLLVFMLTHDAVAGEREEGTLRLLLSGPVPRDLVLMGKWLGGYASVLLPFLTGFVLVVTVLYFTPSITIHPQDWLRIGALLVLCALYVAVIFSVALTFSVLFRHSTTVSMALLVVWAVGIVAWPAGTPYLAHAMLRPPTTAQTELEITKLTLFESPGDGRYDDAYRKLFGDKRREDLTDDERRQWQETSERVTHGIWRTLIDTMRVEADKLTASERAPVPLAQALARASPFGCFQNACIRMAGTGIDREAHLRQTVAEYLRTAWGFTIERLEKDGGHPAMARYQPRIRYSEPSAASALAGCGIDVALLALTGVLAFMLAYVLFLRMDIT
jgi:ABC-type transport system involved in multi-copper enzyme maturation permease subunit